MTNGEKISYILDEYKEVGLDYRYRDQMMVQELSLSMVAIGILVSVISSSIGNEVRIATQIFGLLYLMILAIHLRNTDQDRRAALHRRDTLKGELDFAAVHLNVDQRQRTSAPSLMVWFVGAVAVAWGIWTLVTLLSLVCPPS